MRTEVAPGIHRFANPVVNWYLIVTDDGITAIDAGFPPDWQHLCLALEWFGRTFADLEAIVITHAHVDHLGFAERARRDASATVYVPAGDAQLVRHPLRAAKSERNPLRYVLRQAPTRRLYWEALKQGGVRGEVLRDFTTYTDGQVLPVPGAPSVVFTPGHTFGHSALLLEDLSLIHI